MTWFRIDDHFHDHRKVRALGRSRAGAVGLWTLCGTWSADNTSDGFVPDEIVVRWDARKKLAATLVRVGLWHEVDVDGERGYQFHQWEEHQPTRAEVLDKRQKRQAAGRLGGVQSGRSRRSKNEAIASPIVEPPSRPVPKDKELRDLGGSVPVGQRARTNAADLAATAHSPAAHRLVETYANTCRKRPPTSVLTDVAVQVDALLAENWTPEELTPAIAAWGAKGLHPKTLPSVAHEITNANPLAAAQTNGNGFTSQTDANILAFLGKTGTDSNVLQLPRGES